MRKRLIIAFALMAATAAYYSLRLAPREVTGEVFVQIRNGRVVFAPAADVMAFRSESKRGKKWFAYRFLNENRDRDVEATHVTTTSDVKALRQTLLYGKDLGALAEVQAMPQDVGGERVNVTCDAHGHFKIRLSPGRYWIVASGRAGNINGIWSKEIDVPDESKIEFGEGDATFDKPTED